MLCLERGSRESSWSRFDIIGQRAVIVQCEQPQDLLLRRAEETTEVESRSIDEPGDGTSGTEVLSAQS